jgi:hypothetical protein
MIRRLLSRFGIRVRREEVLRPGDVFKVNTEMLDTLVSGNIEVVLQAVRSHDDGTKELFLSNAKNRPLTL